MLLDDYIQNFLIYLQTQRRYSERTVITYRKSLEKYLAMLAGMHSAAPMHSKQPQPRRLRLLNRSLKQTSRISCGT